jgi:hypothetical protein
MIVLVIAIGATAIILNLSQVAQRSPFSVSRLEYINTQSKYQALLFGVSVLVLFTVYFVNKENFLTFFTQGNIAAPAKGVSWLGIPEGESWRSLGVSLSFSVTLATCTFIYLQFRKSINDLRQFLPYLPWVLLFSVTNSFSEEVIYRLGTIVPLVDSINSSYILIIFLVRHTFAVCPTE